MRRPTVAVVGSGMAGLVTAHSLAGTHDVTVFEANGENTGLSGFGVPMAGITVDIPLRMSSLGYYITVSRLATSNFLA